MKPVKIERLPGATAKIKIGETGSYSQINEVGSVYLTLKQNGRPFLQFLI